MQILGALVVIGLLIWGLVWFVMNFWPWILGVGVTWLVVWFIWPDAVFWLRVSSIRAASRRAIREADHICEDTINDIDQADGRQL